MRNLGRFAPAYLVLLFAISRVAAHLAGVRFHASNLTGQWHFLPVELLKEDLLRSILSLHVQPPLFNLFLGVGLKLFPDPSLFFQSVFLVLSLSLLLMLFRLLVLLGVSRQSSCVLVSSFALNPSLFFYENYLFYPLWEAVFLTGTALSVTKYVQSGFTRTSFALLSSFFATSLVFSRASFHPLWALGLVALLAWVAKRASLPLRRLHWGILLLPLVLAGSWMGKNFLLIDQFAMSSALGMGVIKNSLLNLSEPEVTSLVRSGAISPLPLRAPFLAIVSYRDIVPESRPRGISALDLEVGRNGFPNPNHRDYAAVSRHMLRDAWTLAVHHPLAYAGAVVEAASLFFRPSDELEVPRIAMDGISGLTRTYRAILFHSTRASLFEILFLWMGVVAIPVIAGSLKAYGALPSPRGFLLLFSAFTVIYLTSICWLLEVGENNRVRFCLNPLLFCSLVALAKEIASRAHTRLLKFPLSLVGFRMRS